MAHFHGLCHRSCGLRYVRRILWPIKLDLGVVKANSMLKKDNFRGLIAKIGCLRSILAMEPLRPPKIELSEL